MWDPGRMWSINAGIVYIQSLTRMTGPTDQGNYLLAHIIAPIVRIG